jgi:hypothetical protein
MQRINIKMLSIRRNTCKRFPSVEICTFLHLLIYCCHCFTVNAQFFGGSSRLEDQAQEITKDMAQEYKEIIEDKE